MNEITKKALALINQVEADRGFALSRYNSKSDIAEEALCRAIEQHEAYKQRVSDALVDYFGEHLVAEDGGDALASFIIPKPTVDPLAVALAEWEGVPNHGRGYAHDAKVFREALAKRDLKIVEVER